MERFLSLAIGLTDAVSAAHRQGILHRDLKPENVMLTPDGRLKVLDFGLAKLRFDGPDEGDQTTRETQSVTQDGRIVGTVAYMSPEQAQGLPVDHRSDIFTLGILLYEMATGERPFRGNTNLSVLSSILKDTPRPASELRDDIPKPLARMIQRALEKRPEDRYQSTTDLRRDLEDLKRDVDSGELVLGTTAGRPRLVAARRADAAAGPCPPRSARRSWSWRRWRRSSSAASRPPPPRTAGARWPSSTSTTSPATRSSTGCAPASPTCWSPTCRSRPACASSARPASTSSSRTPATATSARCRRRWWSRSRARRGPRPPSWAASCAPGSQIRISASVQDPRSGEVLASERVEGDAESGLFALVDELTGRLRKRLETPPRARMADEKRRHWKEKKLEEVTTASMEAFKAYAEGSRLHDRLQEKEAQAYFEKAVEADPGFAMALAKLSVVHANQGNLDKARAYAAKAVEKAGNLPPAERFYIEGRYYSLDPALDREGGRGVPEGGGRGPRPHRGPEQSRAAAHRACSATPRLSRHLEELRRQGMTFPGSYMSLAEAYVATGQPEQAREALRDYAAEHPDRSAAYENIAFFELGAGPTSTRRSPPSTRRRRATPTA